MENTFKGTKGKWEINPRASRNVRCNKVTVANCSQGQNGEYEDEEKANALLISKAPELLNTLQMQVDEVELSDMEFYQKWGFNVAELHSKTKQLIKESTEI